MKIFLVSKIDCYSDEKMEKDFVAFTTFNEAAAYKDELVSHIIDSLLEHYDLPKTDEGEDELLNDTIEITSDNVWIWGYLSPDCTHEVEIEISELDLMTWKDSEDIGL